MPGRREIVLGDVDRQPAAEIPEKRAIRAHACQQRLDRHPGRGGLAQDQPHRATAAELHEHRLTEGDTRERRRHGIGEGAASWHTGGVHGHLDAARLRHDGKHSYTRMRRSAKRSCSAAMMASIASAVRSIWPVSFTTT